jgi:hypothetical protein
VADLFGTANTAEVALAAATTKTVIQIIAPTNHRVKVMGWGVFFDGTSATAEPVQVELLRQTSALTPVKTDAASEPLLTTAQHTATAEPTASDVLDVVEVHPQASYERVCSTPGSQLFVVGGGGRVGIRCTAPAAVNVRAKIFFEE